MLIYGSIAQPYNPVNPSRVGKTLIPKIEDKNSDFSFLAIVKGIVIVGEIALSFIPGLGQVAQLGIGLASAGLLTGIDAQQGQFSVLNTIINFASVAVSGAFGLRQGKKIAKGLQKEIAKTNAELIRVRKIKNRSQVIKLNRRLKVLKQISLSEFETSGSLFQKVNKLVKKDEKFAKSIVSGIQTRSKSARLLTPNERQFIKQVQKQQRLIRKVLNPTQTKLYNQILDVRTRPADLNKLVVGLRRSLNKEQIDLIQQQTLNFKAFLKYGARPLSLKDNRLKRFIKFAGTSEYNDKVVQRVQNVDANDLGRYPVERMYQALKKRIRSSKVTWLKKGLKAQVKVENAWTKAGGVWMGGEFIDGYKIISAPAQGTLTKTQVVLIRFNKTNTRAINKQWRGKATNNFGGKKDVIVAMSDWQLKKLRDLGGQYYLEKFARTKGGQYGGVWKRASGIPLNNELSLFLGFIPNNALRLNLSIISNLVENVADMTEGKWHREFGGKWLRSFGRAIVNRSARLITREVLPKIGVSHMVAREISRFTAGTLRSYMTTNSKGQLQFRVPTGQTFGRNMALTAIAGMRGGLNRTARKQGKLTARNLGANLQFQQGIRRIPGAITPNKAFNSRSFLKFKL